MNQILSLYWKESKSNRLFKKKKLKKKKKTLKENIRLTKTI